MLSPRWKKVVQDLRGDLSRTLIIVASTAIGVIAFGGLLTARATVSENMARTYSASNTYDIAITLPPFDDELVRWMEGQQYVTGAEGFTQYTARLLVDGESHDVTLHAFDDLDAVSINQFEFQDGAQPPESGEFLIERSYSRQVALDRGESATVIINDDTNQAYPLRYAGKVFDFSVPPGTFNTQVQLYISARTLPTLGLSADYNRLYVTVQRPAPFDFFAPSVTEIGDQLREDLTRHGVRVLSISADEDKKPLVADTVNGLVLILVVVGTFSLILSSFLVINTISGLMMQQKRQIGVMKIIGASRGQIVTIYLVMVACYGALALLVALPASALLGRGITAILAVPINFDVQNFRLPVQIIVMETFAAFLAPMIAALPSILGGTQITAAQAITDYSASAQTNLIDVTLAKISVLPRPMLLALRGVFRRKLRLLMTIVTLILAGAFFIAILNVRAAVQKDVRSFNGMSNYSVQIALAQPYSLQGIQERVNTVSGVASVEGWLLTAAARVRPDGVESAAIRLYGLPQNSAFIKPVIQQGRWLLPMTPANRYDIVISDDLLDDEKGLTVGGTIKLTYQGEEQVWNIVGVINGDQGPGGASGAAYSYYDSIAHFVRMPDQTNTVMILTQDQTSALQNRVADEVSARFDHDDISIARTDVRENRVTQILNGFDTVITLLMVTAVMIAAVGGLGLAGTMSLSVLERTREIGVMRSVGAGTGVLRFMFVAEGMFIGLLSFMIAFPLSIFATGGFATAIGMAIIRQPFSSALNPVGPVLWLVIVMVVSAAASLMPAQRASQISIREALNYE